MLIDTISFPVEIIDNLGSSDLVVFAGAGVSMGPPANLPDFENLCTQIAEGTGEIPCAPFDRFLGTLDHRDVLVHKRAAEALTNPHTQHKQLHSDLLRLFPSADKVKLVTTNFDTLFEQAACTVFDEQCETYSAPALPLGKNFNGIIHIHGIVNKPQGMVLTDRDFGKAYLTEGWARRFLVDLFMSHTVLFIGYRHEDTVIEYLTRALPRQGKKNQFILVSEDDSGRWEEKGITPIEFVKPSSHDYSNLDNGVKELAEFTNRKVTDWENKIRRLASNRPPVDLKDKDTIIHALKEEFTTRFFTQHAKSPEWIPWLDDQGILNSLFEKSPLSQQDELLADWAASNFAVRHHEELMAVLSKHNMHINQSLWRSIARTISFEKEVIIPIESFFRWVILLCDSQPEYVDSHTYLFMAKQASRLQQADLLPTIFNALTSSKLSVKIIPKYYREEEDENITIEVKDTADHYCAKEILESLMMPRINKVYSKVFNMTVTQHRSRYERVKHFKCNIEHRDWASWGRYGIEPHDQDEYEKTEDVIINATRNSLEYACQHDTPTAHAWIKFLLREESSLLKRIGVHGLRHLNTISHDQKINLTIDSNHLLDSDLRHEIFSLLKDSYSQASDEQRELVVKQVLFFRFPPDEDDHEEATDREHFTWLAWLKDSMPSCTFATSSLEHLQKKYPDWTNREHPDLTHWHHGGWDGYNSPWTCEELLAMDLKDHLDSLMTYERSDFRGPDRNGLLHEILQAAEINTEWSLNLAETLARENHWDSDLWPKLIKAWGKTNPNDEANKQINAWLGNSNVQEQHARYVSEALYRFVEGDKKKFSLDSLTQLNKIGSGHFKHAINATDKPEHNKRKWIQHAINNAPGILAEFWMHSLSMWKKLNKDKSGLPKTYKTEMEKMLHNESNASGYFISVICSQLNFLLSTDEDWTSKQVVPLFNNTKNPQIMNQAWDGYLTWGRPTPTSFSYLESTFKNFNDTDFLDEEEHRDRFIEFITICILYYVKDEHAKWIETIFKDGNEKDIMAFCYKVHSYLRESDNKHKEKTWNLWLKQYIKRRIDGIPNRLSGKEIETMVSWPIYLPFAFDEATRLIDSMPEEGIEHCSLVWRLRNNSLNESHTNAVCNLLNYLSRCDMPSYCWHGIKDVARQLFANTPDPEIKAKLVNNLKRLGVQYE